MWVLPRFLIGKRPCFLLPHLRPRLEMVRCLHTPELALASSGTQSSPPSVNSRLRPSLPTQNTSLDAVEAERNPAQHRLRCNGREGIESSAMEAIKVKRSTEGVDGVDMRNKRYEDGERMKDGSTTENDQSKTNVGVEIKTSSNDDPMEDVVSMGSLEEDSDHVKDEEFAERAKCEGCEALKDDASMETGTNMDDLGKGTASLRPQDLKIVQDICAYLDGRPWNDDTESLLEEKYGLQISHLVVSRVILKQRQMAILVPFFRWASKQIGRDIHSSHAYLLKLGELKHFDKMWAHLDDMKGSGCQVKVTAFCILIKAYGAARMPAMAVEAFKKMGEYNVEAEIHAYTTLLSVFFLSKLVDEARLCYSRVLQAGLCIDVSAFSTLIRGFGMLSHIQDAQSCFNAMVNEGHEPDVSTCNGLIEGFFQINAVKDALSMFSDLQKRGLKPNVFTFNIIIKAYCRMGRLEDAINTFASMRKICLPNQSTFNILLQGLLSGDDTVKAMNFFKLMENEGWVDARSYIFLCNGLSQAKQTQEMLDLLKSLFAKHGFANIEVCNALVNNLSLLGRIEEAEEIFKGMVSAGATVVPSYAIMIKSYCRLKNIDKAQKLLSELKMQGGKPSVFCYTPIISSLVKENKPTKAMKYLEEMMSCGLDADASVYDLFLKALCRQDEVVDALRICNIVIENKFVISIDTLFDLMKCLCKLGRVGEANELLLIMYKHGCLPKVKAISQAMRVMDLVMPSCEKIVAT